jgi:D-glycero-D-manno-heptose 1,7-bisphosphate phosphatase
VTNHAVFLDRDGVLNRAIVRDGKPYPPATAEQAEIVPRARESLLRLKKAGLLLFVVTNQPDVARGQADISVIEDIHRKLSSNLPLDDFFVCPHDDSDQCSCRKPLPGLFFTAAARYQVDLKRSFMVGDRWRDVEAGQAAGCRTVWIDYHYRERGPLRPPDAVVSSLAEAVDWILSQATTHSKGD